MKLIKRLLQKAKCPLCNKKRFSFTLKRRVYIDKRLGRMTSQSEMCNKCFGKVNKALG